MPVDWPMDSVFKGCAASTAPLRTSSRVSCELTIGAAVDCPMDSVPVGRAAAIAPALTSSLDTAPFICSGR